MTQTQTHEPAFATVTSALEDFARGRMIIVVDDEDRENEGDLTLAAEFVTPEAINFMARHGRGLICLTLTEERADYLRLPPMSSQNTSRFGTAFTESIEAREGVTTGISAYDRSHTIRVAIDPKSTAQDLARPGHVFPLRARKGGVLVRAGQTEASVDLARMAGLIPAGVICEIMNDDGTMARVPDLIHFARRHGLKILTVAELIRHRLQHERYVCRVGESTLPTAYGDFRMIAYESQIDGESHIALVLGDVQSASGPALVRMHTHCLAGDVFGTTLCDCRSVVDASLQAIAREGRGALLYLHNATKGFGIDATNQADGKHAQADGQHAQADGLHPATPPILFHHELRAREHSSERLQRTLRQIGIGGQVLADLGIRQIRLLTNNPVHVPALQGFNLEIVEHVPLRPERFTDSIPVSLVTPT